MSDNPLTLSLARLSRVLGSTPHQDLVWVTPDDLSAPSISTAPDVPLDMSVDFINVEDGAFVQLATSVDLIGECVRCLDEVRGHRDIFSTEVYFRADAPALASPEGDGEVEGLFVIGERDTVDIKTQLCDAIVLLVDPHPLCSEDYTNLCDICGKRWVDLPFDHEHFAVDPRLVSLASLLGSDAEPG